ncbi:MAG: hypothetical protein E6J10_01410 [Chloroflexi bacterium]|nr:MAG: hypothetical protein E6J10_01410 [Chloroflexota bacterium]
MKLALKITPQRSTQYANMAEVLAAPELLASPVGPAIQEIAPVTLAGQSYLLVTLDDLLSSSTVMPILSRLGATSEVYQYFENLGEVEGPLLRPIEPQFTPFVPLEMAEVRRYKGKTNEVFTQVLLNMALFAGAYAGRFTERLRILDPLAGGGTTLFLGLAAGYDAFGIELERQDVETTAVFTRQYLHSEHIPYKELDERGRRAGRRYQFEIGQKGATKALPVWESMILPGGTLALAWNATRIERANMVELVEQHTHLKVRNDPPYTQLVHTVDRVIKRRDILVAVKEM